MFIESEFSWTITVQPHEFKGAREVQRALIRNLLTGFDSKVCTEEHGFHIAVTWIESVGEGAIKEGKGSLTYPVTFRGLTFKPLKGEIVYGTVSQVSDAGVKAAFGPGEFLIIGKGAGNMGDYTYHEEGEVRLWKNTDDDTRIEQGSSEQVAIDAETPAPPESPLTRYFQEQQFLEEGENEDSSSFLRRRGDRKGKGLYRGAGQR